VSYKRVVITKFGGPEVLQVVEEPSLPEPGPGEVRVRVLATSASFTDTMIRKGKYPGVRQKPPFSPGYDMVGIVDKLGAGVKSPRLGWRVADLCVTGAYSEYICRPAELLVPVLQGLGTPEAVSLVLTYITAYQMLRRTAHVQTGERILVHGAAGAVGTALLQLGSAFGLEMVGTASSGKQELVESLGAVPIDYQNEDFVKRIDELTDDGVDVAFDGIGGDNLTRSFRSLRDGGRLVGFGFTNAVMGRGGVIPLDLLWLRLWDWFPNKRSASFYSIAPTRKRHSQWFRDDLSALYDLLARGRIKPVIGKYLPLAQAAYAHQLVEQAAVPGKIVLIVGEET